MLDVNDFDQLRSAGDGGRHPHVVHGEVRKPETINYRTLRPEKDGSSARRSSVPQRTGSATAASTSGSASGHHLRALRRRGHPLEGAPRADGHIDSPPPWSHLVLRGTVPGSPTCSWDRGPGELKAKQLEKVIYFAAYLVTKVDEEKRTTTPEPRGELLSEIVRSSAPRPRGRAPAVGPRARARRARGLRAKESGDPRRQRRRARGDIGARRAEQDVAMARKAFDELGNLHAARSSRTSWSGAS